MSAGIAWNGNADIVRHVANWTVANTPDRDLPSVHRNHTLSVIHVVEIDSRIRYDAPLAIYAVFQERVYSVSGTDEQLSIALRDGPCSGLSHLPPEQ